MILITPLKNEAIEGLMAGDIVYLSGKVCTARDKAHQRALAEDKFPVDLREAVLLHAGPAVKKAGGKWSVIAIGPTTSSRMNSFEAEFIEKFSVKAIIGKGGMNGEVAESMKKNKCVYLSMTGGCAATSARQIKKVEGVEWLDLGIPEAVWVLGVENLGPLVVGIDCMGNSLYDEVKNKVSKNLEEINKTLK
jgi:fumarate hydratase subunit beta